MNDGNPSKIQTMINFDKLRMMSNCVSQIATLASGEYKFAERPEIQNYLRLPPTEKNLNSLKQLSLICEPVEK